LGNVDSEILVEQLAEFLRDSAPEVRQAAREALMWDSERRWKKLRHAVRRSLADPICQQDGAFKIEGQRWSEEAVNDWKAWSSEKGMAGQRASMTLGVYYGQLLSEEGNPALVDDLRRQVLSPQVPPTLRHELVHLLKINHELDRSLTEKLLGPTNPAPVRLIAVETLLREGEHAEAQSALIDLARLPNREIAIAVAEVVQRCLGIDMGLALGEPPPPLHTRQAAEVTRRVMTWAFGQDANPEVSPHPLLSRGAQEGT
jgi:hypothetical protein